MQWITGAEQFTDALATSNPTPGGGAAAAMAGAMGCALVMMAVSTTLKRKNTPAENRPKLEKQLTQLEQLHVQLKSFMAQDAKAYEAYLSAVKLPQDNPTRLQTVQEALWKAACVPADTAHACLQVLQVTQTVFPWVAPIIISDVNCAQHLLKSALACCAENIRTNAACITRPDRTEKLQQLAARLAEKTL